MTHGELTRYLKALLKDSEQLAAMIDNIPSIDNLDFIMESDALGHSIMDQQQGHECLSAVADSVTLEDVRRLSLFFLPVVGRSFPASTLLRVNFSPPLGPLCAFPFCRCLRQRSLSEAP